MSTLVQSLQDEISYLSSRLQNQLSFVSAPCLSKMVLSGWSWRGLKSSFLALLGYALASAPPCTTQFTKGFEIEFRALLNEQTLKVALGLV
jgi:hypothetical protein